MTSLYPEDGAFYYFVMMIMQLVLHYGTHKFFTFVQKNVEGTFFKNIFYYPDGAPTDVDIEGRKGLFHNFQWWVVPLVFSAVVLSGGAVTVYFTQIRGK